MYDEKWVGVWSVLSLLSKPTTLNKAHTLIVSFDKNLSNMTVFSSKNEKKASLLRVRVELTISAFLHHKYTIYRYGALADCATGATYAAVGLGQ